MIEKKFKVGKTYYHTNLKYEFVCEKIDEEDNTITYSGEYFDRMQYSACDENPLWYDFSLERHEDRLNSGVIVEVIK